jgi:hypothetical protein
MNTWKKLVAGAVALAIAGGAGGAMASVMDNPPAPDATTSSTKLLGNGVSENKFTPIVPCRILDTRKGYGKLPVGATKTIDVRGSEGTFTTQGGNPGGCGIPTGATAIEATVTAVNSGSGFLRAWPANLVQPNATFMNYDGVFNVSNTGTVTLCGYSGQPCLVNQDLNLRAYGTATDLVIDVAGYYVQPMAANVNSTGTLVRGSRVASATRTSTGTYQVIFDRNVSQCTYFAGTATGNAGVEDGEVTVTNYGANANGVFVRTFNSAGTLTDKGFQVEVIC